MHTLGRYKVPPVAEELLAFDVFWEKESVSLVISVTFQTMIHNYKYFRNSNWTLYT